MSVQRSIFGILTAAVLVAGCGGGSPESQGGSGGSGKSAEPTRTVDVAMRDIAYDPATLSVKAGETVKFVFRNEGKLRHDAFIGDEAAQAEHDKEMREEGSARHGDHGGDAITVDPGETGSLTHTFKAGDMLVIGCHEVGHYAAGMKITVMVT